MNRKERAGAAQNFDELLATARRHLQTGRNNNAAKLFGQALAIDERSAAAHDGLGMALQAKARHHDAIGHFKQAIALGLADVEGLVKQRPVLSACLKRFRDGWPRRLTIAELFGADGLAAAAGEALLLALLQSRPVADIELELFLTSARAGLLAQIASPPDGALDFAVALAQQCFINEYVFSPGPGEPEAARALRDRIAAGAETSTLAMAIAAMYAPMPETAADAPEALIVQQVREPREERADRAAIPALTAIDDPVSREVQRQYEENPYPRWTVATPFRPTTLDDYLRRCLPLASVRHPPAAADILIAGCGTGGHSIETAQRFPQSRILAIDISRTSLAYARRKTREAGIANVEYTQADILKLGALDRSFDFIETVGVLHHLADPAAGFRALVERLKPGGLMLVGLYSELARRPIVAARALIAERGYAPTVEGIRQCRQELINRTQALPSRDFYSVSGCCDLLFNVIEHRFTCPQIKTLIAKSGMMFLGLEVSPEVSRQFRLRFPAPSDSADLDRWAEFETEHPQTFANMYVFWLRKPPA